MSFEAELKNTYAQARQRLLNPQPKTPPKLAIVPKPSTRIPRKRQTIQPFQRNFATEDFEILPIAEVPRLKHILSVVSATSGLDPRDVAGDRRRANFVAARQICCFLAYHYTQYSLGQIGQSLGGKDHTTILHGVRKLEKLLAESELWRNRVKAIMKLLKIDIEIKGIG